MYKQTKTAVGKTVLVCAALVALTGCVDRDMKELQRWTDARSSRITSLRLSLCL